MCRKRICSLRLYNVSSCNNFSGIYQKTREPAGYRRLSVFLELPLLRDVKEVCETASGVPAAGVLEPEDDASNVTCPNG